MSRTFAIAEVTEATYREIEGLLRAAGYEHAIDDGVIDMHGIALRAKREPTLIAFHVHVEFPAADPWLVWIEAENADEARERVVRDTKDAGGVVRDVRRAP